MKIPIIDASSKFEKLDSMQIAILKAHGKLVSKKEAWEIKHTLVNLIRLLDKIDRELETEKRL